MTRCLVLALLLGCAACSQDDAPAEEIAEAAEAIVAPTPAPTSPTRGKYAPQDECGEVEGGREFRNRFAAAVRARDADALVTLAAADIKLDFGGGEGAGELRRRLADPSGALWDELEALTALGCAVNEQGGVTLPWYFEQELGDADPYEAMLVVGADVPVFRGPDGTAERITAISWDMVEAAAFDPESDYQRVDLADGTQGFIATDKLRSLLDYRLIASSRNGKWSITSLVAGD